MQVKIILFDIKTGEVLDHLTQVHDWKIHKQLNTVSTCEIHMPLIPEILHILNELHVWQSAIGIFRKNDDSTHDIIWGGILVGKEILDEERNIILHVQDHLVYLKHRLLVNKRDFDMVDPIDIVKYFIHQINEQENTIKIGLEKISPTDTRITRKYHTDSQYLTTKTYAILQALSEVGKGFFFYLQTHYDKGFKPYLHTVYPVSGRETGYVLLHGKDCTVQSVRESSRWLATDYYAYGNKDAGGVLHHVINKNMRKQYPILDGGRVFNDIHHEQELIEWAYFRLYGLSGHLRDSVIITMIDPLLELQLGDAITIVYQKDPLVKFERIVSQIVYSMNGDTEIRLLNKFAFKQTED